MWTALGVSYFVTKLISSFTEAKINVVSNKSLTKNGGGSAAVIKRSVIGTKRRHARSQPARISAEKYDISTRDECSSWST